MILNQLALRHFRNLTPVELHWNDRFNVIWGKNAQGKTNLLEAIYLLGQLKSFRQAKGRELIVHGGEGALVQGVVSSRGIQHRLEIRLVKLGRLPKIDGKPVQRLSEFFGHLRTVLFSPEELTLIRGYPAGRRALLDRAIVQIDPSYLDRAQEYERVLKQRNQLLKQQASAAEVEPWTEALCRCGARIRQDRADFVARFQPLLDQVYRQITGGREQVEIAYSATASSVDEYIMQIADSLSRLRRREQILGQTLAGPHRDDLTLKVDERSLRSFGSQGQQRSFLLAFKAAQVMDQEKQLGVPPLLLLDDLASELDTERQAGFVDFLLARRGQVFLTTAYPAVLADAIQRQADYFKVDCGTVSTLSPG